MSDDDWNLFDAGLAPIPIATPSDAEQAFETFHELNPWVFDALVRLARDLHDRGRERIGINMLVEVLRWQWTRQTSDPSSEFKINNNYAPRYARLIMDEFDDLEGIFQLREMSI